MDGDIAAGAQGAGRPPRNPLHELKEGGQMQLSKLLLAATAAVAALIFSSSALAYGPRPHFQMPVACGQTWEASTYNGHWPNQNSIDLGEWSANDTNIGQGEPVLASAAGTVLDVFTDLPAGDNRVYLDHGGGWVTHYIHLEIGSRRS